MSARVLLIGCGYVGRPLARVLHAAGNRVTGWVHSPISAAELAGEGLEQIVTGSVADSAVWRELPRDFDLVIHAASSGGGGLPAYEEVFLRGVEQIAAHLPESRPLLVSSTSVYGQTGGEIVTEDSPADPSTATGRVLRQAEEAARSRGMIVVRSAGIYGPGRGVLLEKLRNGTAVLEAGGGRWMNQIHRDDLVAALRHLLEQGKPGEIYNAADDTPVTQLDYYRWCAAFLDVPLPPEGPADPTRKRGLTSKRVSNARLRSTGWSPLYPSFREGLAADHSPR